MPFDVISACKCKNTVLYYKKVVYMDYNYVRMRNALKDGDTESAEKYRRLYEKRLYKKEDTHRLNILLVVLFALAVALGIYSALLLSQENEVTAPEPAEAAESEDIGELPVVGSDAAENTSDGVDVPAAD